MHWSYVFLALTHNYVMFCFPVFLGSISCSCQISGGVFAQYLSGLPNWKWGKWIFATVPEKQIAEDKG